MKFSINSRTVTPKNNENWLVTTITSEIYEAVIDTKLSEEYEGTIIRDILKAFHINK